jgi:hypothetical protein
MKTNTIERVAFKDAVDIETTASMAFALSLAKVFYRKNASKSDGLRDIS